MTVIARDMARRIAATLPQLYDIDYLEPGGEPVEADMVALVETVLRDANTQGAVSPEITNAELDAAWAAWVEHWVTEDGRTAMRSALVAFLTTRGGR